jgi:ElaB/YqjD/DUF883 family membrane-anchored ribosome-binding protein
MTTDIIATPAPGEGAKETFTRDIKGIVGKAENLFKDASHTAAEELSATRHAISEKACSAASATHEYVRGNPWKIVGIAAAAGVFIGAMISRR